MIFEIKDVLGRNKLKKYLNNSIEFYISFIKNISISNVSVTHYNRAPDKDDNYLYDICLSANSTLVTGDKLLLDYKSDPIVLTITRNDFLNIFK
jgi:putative PIN family toxin of toxin-antitoxin system